MTRSPEEQKAEVLDAASRAEKVAKAAKAAASGPENPAASKSPKSNFDTEMAKFIAELPADKPSTAIKHATNVDEVANLMASIELQESIKTIARASARSPLAGEQALLGELNSNPDLMAKFGAHPAKNGKSQSLGNLDLDGDGNYSSIEGMAIAATINAMQVNRSHADIAGSLRTKGFREQATAIMRDMSADLDPNVYEAGQPKNTPDCTQKGGFLIPRPKGCPRL